MAPFHAGPLQNGKVSPLCGSGAGGNVPGAASQPYIHVPGGPGSRDALLQRTGLFSLRRRPFSKLYASCDGEESGVMRLVRFCRRPQVSNQHLETGSKNKNCVVGGTESTRLREMSTLANGVLSTRAPRSSPQSIMVASLPPACRSRERARRMAVRNQSTTLSQEGEKKRHGLTVAGTLRKTAPSPKHSCTLNVDTRQGAISDLQALRVQQATRRSCFQTHPHSTSLNYR